MDNMFNRLGAPMGMSSDWYTPTSTTSLTRPRTRTGVTSDFVPPVDVIDEDKQVIVHAELPGMSKDKINIDARGFTLIMSGNLGSDIPAEDWNRVRVRERAYGKFDRRVVMPTDCDMDNVQAKYENGLLEVRVPKKPEAQVTRKTITVE